MTNAGDSAHDDAALARMRRKKRLHGGDSPRDTKRVCSDEEDDREPDDVTSASRKKPHITGIKKHARYDPGVPMSKDELTAWRKEARRVRNRESAAASRRRTRDRISELEGQVEVLESRYSAALKRIAELEAAATNPFHKFTSSSKSTKNETTSIVSPCSSGSSSPVAGPASPVHSPPPLALDSHQVEVEKRCQHIMDMISGPTA